MVVSYGYLGWLLLFVGVVVLDGRGYWCDGGEVVLLMTNGLPNGMSLFDEYLVFGLGCVRRWRRLILNAFIWDDLWLTTVQWRLIENMVSGGGILFAMVVIWMMGECASMVNNFVSVVFRTCDYIDLIIIGW